MSKWVTILVGNGLDPIAAFPAVDQEDGKSIITRISDELEEDFNGFVLPIESVPDFIEDWHDRV